MTKTRRATRCRTSQLPYDDGPAVDDEAALVPSAEPAGLPAGEDRGGAGVGRVTRPIMTEARVGRLLAACLHQAIVGRAAAAARVLRGLARSRRACATAASAWRRSRPCSASCGPKATAYEPGGGARRDAGGRVDGALDASRRSAGFSRCAAAAVAGAGRAARRRPDRPRCAAAPATRQDARPPWPRAALDVAIVAVLRRARAAGRCRSAAFYAAVAVETLERFGLAPQAPDRRSAAPSTGGRAS